MLLQDFVLFGIDGVWVKQGSQVQSGHVGANLVGIGPYLGGSSHETLIGKTVTIDPVVQIYGDSVKISQGAVVFDVYANETGGIGTISGLVTCPQF